MSNHTASLVYPPSFPTGYANQQTQESLAEIYAETNTTEVESKDPVGRSDNIQEATSVKGPARDNLDSLLDFAQTTLAEKKNTGAATACIHRHQIVRWPAGQAEFVHRTANKAGTRVTLTTAPTSGFGALGNPLQGSCPILIAEDTRNHGVQSIAFILTEKQATDIQTDMSRFPLEPKKPQNFTQFPKTLERYANTLTKYLSPGDSDARRKQIFDWGLEDLRYDLPDDNTEQDRQHHQDLATDMLSDDPLEAALLRREHNARIKQQSVANADTVSETDGGMAQYQTDFDAIADMGRAILDPEYGISSESDGKWNTTRHHGANSARTDVHACVDVIEARSENPHNPKSVSIVIPGQVPTSSVAFDNPSSLGSTKYDRPRAIVSFKSGATERSLSLPLSKSLAYHLETQLAKIECSNEAPLCFLDGSDASVKFCERLNKSGAQDSYEQKIGWKPADISWGTQDEDDAMIQ